MPGEAPADIRKCFCPYKHHYYGGCITLNIIVHVNQIWNYVANRIGCFFAIAVNGSQSLSLYQYDDDWISSMDRELDCRLNSLITYTADLGCCALRFQVRRMGR
eukprot:scaffold242276_cov39-Prasinocladus_malaysianus.AAC.1